MTIQRDPKGTVALKASGTTLTISNVSINQGSALVVGAAWITGQGDPTIKWGFRELDRIVIRSQSSRACAIFVLRNIKNNATRDIVATWAGSIGPRAMFASMITGAKLQDVSTGNTQVATTSPNTGTVTTSESNTMCIAAFCSRGPGSDTIGTVGDGHTSGQRVGVVGAPPISNITIHETFEELTSIGSCGSSKSGATERDWANVIVAFKDNTELRQGITPTDVIGAEQAFNSLSLDFRNAVFYWNSTEDRWEVYDVADIGTLIAHNSNGWA